MKFICEKALLESAIAPLSRVVSGKATLPILENILVLATAEGVRFAATDLEIGMKTFIPAKVEESGTTTIPVRVFFEVVSHIGEGLIEVQLDPETALVHLKGEGFHYKFNVLAADGYPVLPEPPKDARVTLAQQELKKALRDMLFSASSPREDNLIFTGALLSLEKGTLTFVALDGHRLAKRTLSIKKTDSLKSVIIPARALSELSKILKEVEDPIEIYFGEHQVMFKLGDSIFFSRLLEGQFPQYQLIIPEKSDTSLQVDKEMLLAAVRRASILAQERESPRLIKLSLEGEKLVITSNTQDLGQAYEEVPVKVERMSDKSNVTIGFNARYLIDALGVLDESDVCFEFGGVKSPGVLRPVTGDSAIYVVMPIRPLGDVVIGSKEAEERPLAASSRT